MNTESKPAASAAADGPAKSNELPSTGGGALATACLLTASLFKSPAIDGWPVADRFWPILGLVLALLATAASALSFWEAKRGWRLASVVVCILPGLPLVWVAIRSIVFAFVKP